MSSAEYSCKLFKPIFAYRQTVWTLIRLLLEEQSDLGPHCLQNWLLKSQADDKADDNCCDWQFKGYTEWIHLQGYTIFISSFIVGHSGPSISHVPLVIRSSTSSTVYSLECYTSLLFWIPVPHLLATSPLELYRGLQVYPVTSNLQ